MVIIGINAFHGDSSACLLHDGVLKSAVEEERFNRIKHWAGFPARSIRYCLDHAGLSIAEVDHVAINTDPKAHLLKKAKYVVLNRPNPRLIIDRLRNRRRRMALEEELQQAFPDSPLRARMHNVEHHLAHMASAHLVSPFEDSVSVSVDGFGDFCSAAWGPCRGSALSVEGRVFYPHSMGIFYQAMTQFLGFPHYGDEYKVMGLAPYGKLVLMDRMREVVHSCPDGTFSLNLDYFRHHRSQIEYKWSGGSPEVGDLFEEQALTNLLGFARRKPDELLENHHRDLAHSVQAMYEEIFFNLLEVSHAKYGIENLTLAGGCAMNSVANGKVCRRSKFKRVYIQSAAGDAGGAIGAALVVSNKVGGAKGRFIMDHAHWGPSFDNHYHGQLLMEETDRIKSEGCDVVKIDKEEELCLKTAQAISEGKVIGWFQGRMEWGPRALGNRSILCDPCRADMKDILNQKIKRRESFRPFAPSILREKVNEWFEEEDDVPFMMQVFQIREEKRSKIPAVTHLDGSGRLQTVHRETNPIYYRLIESFASITGVPLVLNTSFNENEPVVCRPEEALACFLRTKMDVLVLGNWLVTRS